jgi:hypothetical protein
VVAYQALSWHSWIAGDLENLAVYSKKYVEMAKEHNFRFYLGIAKLFYGANIYLNHTEGEDAESVIKDGYHTLTESCRSNPTIMHSVFGLILGRYYLIHEKNELFLPFIDEIISASQHNEERYYLDELYLLKAEFYRKNKDIQTSTKLLQEALEIAKKNKATRIIEKIKSIINI